MLDTQAIRRIQRVTALLLLAALLFSLFFQLNKAGPAGAINPFAEDPYDALGSFAFQAALLLGWLSYGRAVRLRQNPVLASRSRYILRGDLLVWVAILATLLADTAALFQTRRVFEAVWVSFWGRVLLGELAGMFGLALVCAVALLAVFARLELPAPPQDLTPADAIDDLWALVRPAVDVTARLIGRLAGPAYRGSRMARIVAGIAGPGYSLSDRLFARLGWVSPRRHPWRFAVALSLLAGMALFAVQLREGPPPSLWTGLLLAGIFIGGECSAVLLGFALLGGFLGLRPRRR